MRIHGDNFAIASEQGLYISAWNWKSGEHQSDFVRNSFPQLKKYAEGAAKQMASLQSSTFDFLDDDHILFPSSIDESLYVYDIRSMPPTHSKRPKSKGTHCFDIPVAKFLDNHSECSLDLRCNSLSSGDGPFHADPHQRIVTLLLSAGPNPTLTGTQRQEQCEMHARASVLLAWTEMHPAPPNACVVVPWSAWGPAAARVGATRIDDATLCASKSRFLGSGMRVISPPSARGDGASVVTVTDYHPARVFRGLRAEKQQSHTSPTQMLAHADPGWDNARLAPIPIPGRDPRVCPSLQYALYLHSSPLLKLICSPSLPAVVACVECP